jgi:short-subunit dehydrogenase
LPRPIAGSSVVITGASSGIGHCAALEFAHRGASLTLAAREPDSLEATAAECSRLGAEAAPVPTDVADGEAVERLATEAERRHGRIDTWVNGAGVMAYGTFDQLPADVFERVIETNLTGQVHGSRAALSRFRRQRAGVLINICSVWGRITTPLVTPYVVSKHAVRAFSECLRHELVDAPEIYVTTVLPQAVDTPIFEHSANYSRRRLRPMPPLYGPGHVAEGIVACAAAPKREVVYGRAGRSLEVLYALAPRLYCRLAPAMFMRGTFVDEPAEIGAGNVFEPSGGRPSGGWRANRRRELAGALGAASVGLVLGLAGRAARAKPGSD